MSEHNYSVSIARGRKTATKFLVNEERESEHLFSEFNKQLKFGNKEPTGKKIPFLTNILCLMYRRALITGPLQICERLNRRFWNDQSDWFIPSRSAAIEENIQNALSFRLGMPKWYENSTKLPSNFL